MRIEDLTPYTYSRRKGLEDAVAIGWLEGNIPVDNIGKTPVEVITMLKKYKTQNKCRGVHMCEYCDDRGERVENGNGEIWVIKNDKLYIAPFLIIHYIEEHNYKPPQEFIDAVIGGFRPDSPGYEMRLRSILK